MSDFKHFELKRLLERGCDVAVFVHVENWTTWPAPRSEPARALRTRIHVVHIGPGSSDDLAWADAVARARAAGALLVAVRVLPEVVHRKAYAAAANELAARIEESNPGMAVTSVVTRGDVAPALARVAWHVGADLIIVGADTTRGHEICDLIPRVQAPVLVVRRAPQSGVVIGGTDLSDPTLPVVAAALAEARRRCSGVAYIAHAVEPIVAIQGYSHVPDLMDEIRRDASMLAHTRIRAALRAYPHVQSILIEGPPAHSLIEVGTMLEAELVVVGTIGRRGLRRWLFGNVAEEVACHAPCSVLIVRLQRSRQAHGTAAE